MRISSVGTALALATSAVALSPAQWRGQAIYQVMTDRFARTDGSMIATCNTASQVYCGGTWQGIIKRLNYIQNMGFTAIWISPVVKNLVGSTGDGSAYHGYWAQDIYSLNSNFGAAADLKALSAAIHARGMYLMVDVVTNHMAYAGCGTCVDYSIFNPFNQASQYHSYCPMDYNNATSITDCWEGDNTVSLPDIRTEDAAIQSTFNSWITALVSNYSIDGLRIDSAQQVNEGFFPSFQAAAGVHVLGEILNGNPSYVCPYQNYMTGLLNYPAYYWIVQAFESTTGSISNLVNGINNMKSDCSDTTLLGSFSENHDNARFASMNYDMSQAKNVIAFTILQDGIPIIYAGQEQHYDGGFVPYNREATWLSEYNITSTLYNWTAALNKIRSRAASKDSSYLTYKANPIYSDTTTIVLRKGSTNFQIISVFSNKGSSGASYTLTLSAAQTGFTANQALIEVMGCTAYTTDSSGNLAVAMANGLPRVFYPRAQLAGSSICSSVNGPSSSTTTEAATSTACTTPTSVAVTFNEQKVTVVGQTIKISGNTAALGSWNTTNAISLSASAYTSSDPVWSGTLGLAPGSAIQYKYILIDSTGAVTWEADPNHTLTVAASCVTTATTVNDTWQ